MAYSPYMDLNSLAALPILQPGVGTEVYELFTPVAPPSVIDQRWPTPSEQFQSPPTFNQRWPSLHEQFQNLDHPLFEGPGEDFESFFRQDYASLGPQASLSGPRNQLPGGAIDLGIDYLPSPFVSTPTQNSTQQPDFFSGMTGPYGGTDPRFFGGGVNMGDWQEPPLTPQQQIDIRFPTQWQIDTYMSGNDPGRFDHTFNQFNNSAPSYDQWTMMPGDGDFVDRIRSQSPQTALFSNYDPTPSVYDNTWHLSSSGMTSNPADFGLYTSGTTPDWARIAPGPAPLYTGPTPQPYGGVGPLYGAPGGFFTTPPLGY